MISFNSCLSGFILNNPEKYKTWLHKIIEKAHNKIVGEIVFVFTSDEALHDINLSHLNHDTYTDIITFSTSIKESIISGEIYISIDRVKENAQNSNSDYTQELARVMVHGVLHLIGFNDGSDNEMAIMRSQEDYCLNLLP